MHKHFLARIKLTEGNNFFLFLPFTDVDLLAGTHFDENDSHHSHTINEDAFGAKSMCNRSASNNLQDVQLQHE